MTNVANPQPASGRPKQPRSLIIALMGIALMVALLWSAGAGALAQANPGEASGDAIQMFAIIHGHDESMTGSWNSNDDAKVKELRTRFGEDFAWFRRGGADYVITDSATLKDLDAAMEPQKKVNRMQAEVNASQARVNSMQAKVNAHQGVVNTSQQEVNRRQRLASEAQSALARGDEKVSQETVNRQQAEVNREQADVNAEQAKVNTKQAGVNEEQKRASAVIQRAVQEVFARSLQSGTARQVPRLQ